MKICILGPPGAGKRTHGGKIAKKYKIPYIDAGAILRKNSNKYCNGKRIADYMNKGEIVPDKVVVELVVGEVEGLENYVLDGFPRDKEQYNLSKGKLNFDAVLYLFTSYEDSFDRIKDRFICVKCGISYHLKWKIPKKDLKCDFCNSKLGKREDDKEEIVKKRYKIFVKKSAPVRKFYEKEGISFFIDASGTIEEVWGKIQKALEQKRFETWFYGFGELPRFKCKALTYKEALQKFLNRRTIAKADVEAQSTAGVCVKNLEIVGGRNYPRIFKISSKI